MISIPDSWKVAMRTSGARPAVTVQISTDASTHFYFTSHNAIALGYPPSVAGMTPLAAKIDPRTRKPQSGGFTIDFKDDGALRRLNRDYRLKGKRVIVKIGYEGLAEGSYQPLIRGKIDDVLPATHGKGVLQLRCSDAFSLLTDRNITGEWRARHPMDVINDILTDVGLPSELIDSTTIDKAAAVNSTFAHYLVNRTRFDEDDRTVSTPMSGLKLVAELGALLNGSLVPTEEGKVAFRRYDYTAAVSATWDTSIIRDFRVKEVNGNTVNKISVLMGWINLGLGNDSPDNPRNASENAPEGGEYRYQFDLADADSIAALAYPGMSEGLFADGLSTKWVGMHTALSAALTSGATSMACHALALPAFCGSLGQGDGAYTAYTLSAGNPGYFLVGNEVVKATAVTFGSTNDGGTIAPDEDLEGGGVYQSSITGSGDAATGIATGSGGPSGHADVLTATYTIARAQFGTTAAAHPVSHHVVDVTIGVNMAIDLIGRFSSGVAIVEVDVPLSEHHVQLVDLVDFTHEVYSGYGLDGVTTATNWEVVGKQVTPLGPQAGITFTLALAPTPPSYTKTFSWSEQLRDDSSWALNGPANVNSRLADVLRNGDYFSSHVVGQGATNASGCVVSQVSLLRIAITAGVVIGPSGLRRRAGAMTRAYNVPASKDSYIFFDSSTGLYTRRTVANGAADPTPGPTEVFLAKVVTDATTITAITFTEADTGVTGGKPTKPISGSRLHEEAVKSKNVDHHTQWSRSHLIRNGDFGALAHGDSFDANPGAAGPPDGWEMVTGTWATDAYFALGAGSTGEGGLSLGDGTASVAPKMWGPYFPVEYSRLYRFMVDWTANGTTATFTCKVFWYQSDRKTASATVSNTIEVKTVAVANTREMTPAHFKAPSDARFGRIQIEKSAHANIATVSHVLAETCPSMFHVHKNGSDQASVGTGATLITFDGTEYNNGADWSSASDLYTAPRTGKYRFDTLLYFNTPQSGQTFVCYLSKNGSRYKTIGVEHASSADPLTIQGGLDCELTKGDTIGVYAETFISAETVEGTVNVGAWFTGRELLP